MQINMQEREITVKVVYYGPALSGKTTNLQQLHTLINTDARGKMVTLDTADDRTLYFDFLRSRGVLAPRHFFVDLHVNGRRVGLTALEEHFDRELLESQQRRLGRPGQRRPGVHRELVLQRDGQARRVELEPGIRALERQ